MCASLHRFCILHPTQGLLFCKRIPLLGLCCSLAARLGVCIYCSLHDNPSSGQGAAAKIFAHRDTWHLVILCGALSLGAGPRAIKIAVKLNGSIKSTFKSALA